MDWLLSSCYIHIFKNWEKSSSGSLLSTAMVYYLVYFSFFVFGYFTPSENIDAMTNILIFSLSGIFTVVVFGAAFLSVARTLNKKDYS